MSAPLRIFYLEDNALIVFHIEAMVEELGHLFVGSLTSFSDLRKQFETIEMDGALIDIDLADGRTGPAAAAWLLERGIPSIFVTGQDQTAADHASVALATISKPVDATELSRLLPLFGRPRM